MTRTSYRFLLGVSLLAALAIALVILQLDLDENAAKPDTSGVKPRIFFDNDPRVVAYQIQRLSNDQLVEVERDASDPKYRPAYEALMIRDGLASKYRREAIRALADLNESDVIAEILAGIERVGEQSGTLQRELSNMLLQREPSELARARDRLEQTAAGSEVSAARTASYAALVMCVPAGEVWRLASSGNRGVYDLVQAIPMAPDAKRRDAFYPKVKPLLHGKDTAELRQAAIEILPSFMGHDQESFETLARFIRGGIEQPAAIRSILHIGKEHWLERGSRSLVRGDRYLCHRGAGRCENGYPVSRRSPAWQRTSLHARCRGRREDTRNSRRSRSDSHPAADPDRSNEL